MLRDDSGHGGGRRSTPRDVDPYSLANLRGFAADLA